MKFLMVLEGLASSDDANNDLQTDLDSVMHELMVLDAEDPFIGVDLASRVVRFEVVVSADDFGEAATAALALIRTALHAAGIATHGWDGVARSGNRVDMTRTEGTLIGA